MTLPSTSTFPPQLDGPAIVVCGPTPERADLDREVLVPLGNEIKAHLEAQQRDSVNVLALATHAGFAAVGPVDVARSKLCGLWILGTMLAEEIAVSRRPCFCVSQYAQPL